MLDYRGDLYMHTAATNRREFLAASAGSASALALSSVPFVHASSADTLRIGLIGCGSRGTGAASQALNADADVKLWAMADVFRDRLDSSMRQLQGNRAVSAKIDVPAARQFTGFNAYQELLASNVDVVLLCTPPHFRPAHLRAAIAANKHVFAEKPVAVDGPGVRAVLAACEEARRRNLSVVSGLCYRYEPAKRELMSRIHGGAIGQIVALHTNYNVGGLWKRERQPAWSDMEWQMRNWLYFTWLSGDHNVEQHVHSLDKMVWAMNDAYPVRCVGLGGRQSRTAAEYGQIFDHHAVVYEFENGVKCFSYCRQQDGCANEVADFVIGTEGTAEVQRHRLYNLKRAETWRYRGASADMYQVEHNELFAAIRAGQPINNGVYMAQSTLMGIMGRMATYTGQAITWQGALNSTEDLTPPRYEMGEMPVAPVARPGITRFV
jgi:predicted dehydrogenase